MNIVYQIGDALAERLPKETQSVFVDARQATNDKCIDFVQALLTQPQPEMGEWDANRWWVDIVHEVFDEFYPKQEGGSEERSLALAVQAILATKMIPAISKLLVEERDKVEKIQAEEPPKELKYTEAERQAFFAGQANILIQISLTSKKG